MDIRLRPVPTEIASHYANQIARATSVDQEASGIGTFTAVVPVRKEDGREGFEPRLFYHPGVVGFRSGFDRIVLVESVLYRHSLGKEPELLDTLDLRRTNASKIEVRQAGKIDGIAALLPNGLTKRGHQKWLTDLGEQFTLERDDFNQVGVVVVGKEWAGSTLTLVRFRNESWSRHARTYDGAVLRRGLRSGGETLIPSETRFYNPLAK